MTDELRAAREKIDALDRRIAALLGRRLAIAAPLAGLKKKVSDPARELRVLANARAHAGARIYEAGVTAVFKEIIRQSKKLQR